VLSRAGFTSHEYLAPSETLRIEREKERGGRRRRREADRDKEIEKTRE